MALVTTVSHVLQLKDSSGYSIVPPWVQSLLAFNTTYASRPEILTIGVTSTPTATTINGLSGASPVTMLLINSGTADITVLGIAGFTQVVRAGKFLFVDQFVTTSNLTLSVASGTGEAVVVLLD